MLREYKTIKAPAEAEYIIKKSRFIGRVFPVESLEEAQNIIDEIKKKYWDATHNCSACITGTAGEYSRCSDDGEPQGTAGVPMLEALKMSGLTNVLCIVTRYFGGIKLGAGGLVRAYVKGVSEALLKAHKIELKPCEIYRADFSFKMWGKSEAVVRAEGFAVKNIEYAENVKAEIGVFAGQEQRFLKLISELTGGKSVPEKLREEYIEVSIQEA